MARVDQATHRAVWTLRADDLTLTVGSGLQAAANLKQAPARNRLHAGNMLHAPILTYYLPTRAGSLIPPSTINQHFKGGIRQSRPTFSNSYETISTSRSFLEVNVWGA